MMIYSSISSIFINNTIVDGRLLAEELTEVIEGFVSKVIGGLPRLSMF